MRKKLGVLLLAGFLALGSILIPETRALANPGQDEVIQVVDDTGISQEEGKIGYMQVMPRGIYLEGGFSSISKAGEGRLTAGGGTSAHVIVDKISIAVEVQKLTDGRWKTYLMWSVEKEKKADIMTSKTFDAEPGYYRVMSLHSAGSDSSDSATDLFHFE